MEIQSHTSGDKTMHTHHMHIRFLRVSSFEAQKPHKTTHSKTKAEKNISPFSSRLLLEMCLLWCVNMHASTIKVKRCSVPLGSVELKNMYSGICWFDEKAPNSGTEKTLKNWSFSFFKMPHAPVKNITVVMWHEWCRVHTRWWISKHAKNRCTA